MSNKGTETALKQEINLNIIPNNQQQLITGAKLNVVLLDMVDTLMYLLGNGSGGAANYENLYNKPSINGYELNGEVSLSALGLISSADIALAYQKKITESNKLAADYISGLAKVAITGDYNDLKNKPEISGGEVSNVSWGEQTATSVALIVEGVGKTLLTPQALDNYVQASTLFENGVIRSTLLPSYVDDVLEYTSRSNFPSTGQAGKIYVALDTNKTYRWGGSTYVVISETIAIGTTAGTAYDGAAGKALADAVAGIPNHYYNKTEIDDILLGYVDDAQIASYYNKTEVDNKLKGYVTNTAFTDAIDDYLTITNAENTYYKKTGGIITGGVTINGATTINNSLSVNSLKIGGISISVNSDGILFVEGTLATSGGLSVRGVSTGSGGGGSASLPAVWESLSGDKDEYKNVQINKSHLTAYLTATEVATSYATRGSLAALDERVTEIESSSTSVSYTPSVTSGQLLGTIVIDGKGSAIYAPSIAGLASESWVTNNFLGLGGGTISGLLTIRRSPSVIKFASGGGDILGFLGFGVANEPAFYENDGATGHTIIHTGNIGSQSVNYATSAGALTTSGNIAAQANSNRSVFFQNYITFDPNASYGIYRGSYISSKLGATDLYISAQNAIVLEAGKVGIGTTSPQYDLHVDGTMYGNLKMLTPRTIWGQSFDGTGDVSGDLYLTAGASQAVAIYGSSNKMLLYSSDSACQFGATQTEAAINGSPLTFYINGAEKMRVNSAGNVLIGATKDWGFNLAVSAIYGDKILGYLGTGGGVMFGNIKEGYGTAIWTQGNGNGYIQQGRSDSNASAYNLILQHLGGNVGIGTGAPAYKLDVNGSVRCGDLTSSGTIAGRSLSVTSVNQSSDRRLKKEESRSTPLTIEDIAQLNVRSYKWIDESMGKELQIGLYAQDVQTIIPEIVRENEQRKSLGLDYGVGGAVFGVIAAQSIVKQIKPTLTEQQKRIVELEQRVEFLEKLTYGGK